MNIPDSFLTVCWLGELVTHGPDAYPAQILRALSVMQEITDRWPITLRNTVITIVTEEIL
jgi:hypothetical protein